MSLVYIVYMFVPGADHFKIGIVRFYNDRCIKYDLEGTIKKK